KTIHVSTTAASAEMAAKARSRVSPSSEPTVMRTAMPTANAAAVARATPCHTERARSRRPMRRRYAKTIATTRAASNPSRSMISDAASICSGNLSPAPAGTPGGPGRQASAEAAHVDVEHQAQRHPRRHHRRAPVAHERQGDTGDRHDAHGHAHVLEDLEDQQGQDATADE